MDKILLIIPKNHSLLSSVNQVCNQTDITYLITNTQNLMTDIYAHHPKGLIVYYDALTYDALESIDSTLEVSYLPTILLVDNQKLVNTVHSIKSATILLSSDISTILPILLKQIVNFSDNFTHLSQGYDTLTLMNDEFKRIMNYYIKATDKYENQIIHQYLSIIYNENPFIENIPSYIWLLENQVDHTNAIWLYRHNDEFSASENIISVLSTEKNYYEFARETGFYINFNKETLSDIDNLEQLIPKELLQYIQPSKNIAVVSTNDILLICYDYNNMIASSDMAIIKAMAVKIDLMKTIKNKMNDVEESFVYTMNALARAAESKDDITGNHIKRVNAFSKVIAKALDLDDQFIANIEIAAQMHDVGKINIPESILNKPGKLTDSEFKIIQSHTLSGEEIIGKSKYLLMASRIARSHHEKYDGSGYPDGISGTDIPLEARIVSIADIYDALRSARCYKPNFSHEESYNIIVNGDGRVEPSHFDPAVLEAFKQNHQKYRQIYLSLQDM